MNRFELTPDQVRVLDFIVLDLLGRYRSLFKIGAFVVPMVDPTGERVFGFVSFELPGYFRTDLTVDEAVTSLPVENACAWVNWHIHGYTPSQVAGYHAAVRLYNKQAWEQRMEAIDIIESK